jgi:hypothetical protein
LAELARLIGQTDPFAAAAKPAPPHPLPSHPLKSRANVRPQYDLPQEDEGAPPSPPPWMQRVRQEAAPPPPPEDYDEPEEYQPAPVHPLHRYAAQQPQAPAQDYYEPPQQYADAEPQPDPSRYDDALYGRVEAGEQDYEGDPAYADDPYAYQDGYEEEPAPKKRSSGLITVAAVLALAVVGTGAALAYRTYVGSPRSGEPPIIKADNSPTKVVPAPSDGGASKTADRMLPGDGGEKLVSREETPVDLNSRSGAPRVVFPPLNQNGNPPPVASVSPVATMPATAANGTLPNNEPRKIKTLAVKGDGSGCGSRGQPGLGQCQPQYADVTGAAGRAAGRSCAHPLGGDQSDPAGGSRGQRRLSGPGLLAEERGRRAGLFQDAARQVPGRAGLPIAGDQARRSRRQGRLLPGHGRSVRLLGRGVAILRQPENCRRTVRRPKELTAVSLTPVLRGA